MGEAASSKMTVNEALKLLRDSWNKGVEYGQENAAARLTQRIVIAGRVKQLRMERGISQEKFSDLISVPFLTYKGYENRKSDIPIYTLVRIANEFDTSMDFLTGRTDEQPSESVEERLRKLEQALLQKTSSEQ